jgi:hypothetical protein
LARGGKGFECGVRDSRADAPFVPAPNPVRRPAQMGVAEEAPHWRGELPQMRGCKPVTPHVTRTTTALKASPQDVRGTTILIRPNQLSVEDLAGPCMRQQEIWRKRLEEAEKLYENAAARLQSALTENAEVAEARQAKSAARAEYLRLLRIFSDLVLRGKAPETAGDPLSPRS